MDVLSQCNGRWPVHLLSRGRTAGWADAVAPPWLSVVLADVRAAADASLAALPPHCPGLSGVRSQPCAEAFSYTFDHIARVIEHFTEALGLDRYALYMQDYGGP